MAEVRFTMDAIADLERLDGSVVRRVLAKIAILRTDAEAGQPLGSKQSSNLTGFRKLLVADRQYRVVYRTDPDGTICVIWVVASRVDAEVYDLALQRLHELGSADPPVLDFVGVIARLRPSDG